MSSDSRLSDGIIQLQFWSPLSLATVFVVMVVICGISGLRYNIFLHGPHQSFQTKIATAYFLFFLCLFVFIIVCIAVICFGNTVFWSC